nr:hypothetical protein [Tanacetum cinerariifolium]
MVVLGVNKPQSDEDRLKLNELMELCTTLQSRILDLEKTKTTQALEIDSLKSKVKKLKKKQRSRTHKLKRLYKVGLTARVESSDDNEDLGEDASKQGKISDIDANEGITLVSTHNDEQMFDFDQDLDYQLAERLQAEEQQELNDEETATLFMQLLEKRRKFFAAKRAEEKRNKVPTQAQQRKIMCTYLKNLEGMKPIDLNGSFALFRRFTNPMDRKKTLITKSTVRRDLQLEHAKDVDCLPNVVIFEQLTLNKKAKRKDTQVPQLSGPTKSVTDEVVNKEMDDSLVRATTTVSSLEAEKDSSNINKIRSNATPNEPGSQGTSSDGGSRILDLEKTKTTQSLEIDSLKSRVKKLKKKQRSRTHKLKRLYKVGLTAREESSDDNEDLGEDASKQGKISDIDANEGITLVSTHNDEQMFDFDQDLDYQLAERLQAEEQQELNDEETATLFMQLLEKRRKFFAAKRAEEKRNKLPTQAQQRIIMCTYLKNLEGMKPIDLNGSFDSIQKMFDRAFKRVSTFVDYKTELVEESSKKAKAEVMEQESSKRACTELEQESSKK